MRAAATAKDEDDSDVLVEKLQEMLSDVREMVYFHMKDAKKMQKEIGRAFENIFHKGTVIECSCRQWAC